MICLTNWASVTDNDWQITKKLNNEILLAARSSLAHQDKPHNLNVEDVKNNRVDKLSEKTSTHCQNTKIHSSPFRLLCCCSTCIHPPQLNLYSSEDKIPFLHSTTINVSPGASHSQCQIANVPNISFFASNKTYLQLVQEHSCVLASLSFSQFNIINFIYINSKPHPFLMSNCKCQIDFSSFSCIKLGLFGAGRRAFMQVGRRLYSMPNKIRGGISLLLSTAINVSSRPSC